MMQPILKVVEEKLKRRLRVFGIAKSKEVYSRKTTTYETETPMVIDESARHLPDDLIRDVTRDEIDDLEEM